MDLKVMPRPNKGHKYILCIIDEVMHYLQHNISHCRWQWIHGQGPGPDQ